MCCRFVKNKAHTPCRTKRPHDRQGSEPKAFSLIANGSNGRDTRRIDKNKQHKAVGLHPMEMVGNAVYQHLSFLSVNHSQRTNHNFFGNKAKNQSNCQLSADTQGTQNGCHELPHLPCPRINTACTHANWKVSQHPYQEHANHNKARCAV